MLGVNTKTMESKYKKTVATLTLGCKVNQYEMDAMRESLLKNGYQVVEFDEVADIYLVNTCSVTNMAERKSRQMLHRAKKMNPNAIIVAAGCYVQAAKDEVLADLSVDLIVGNNCKQDIAIILDRFFASNQKTENLIDINQTKEYENLQLSQPTEHTRAYIKIQDGCNQFCSYCIIPYARGRIRSRRPEDVLEEVKRLAAINCKEIVLTGIHLSSYGIDIQGTSLIDIVEKISTVEGIERIRLGSLEPRIITEDFVMRLKAIDKFCPHFHLSLQSACNETLRRMNRKYTIEEYIEKCNMLRQHFDRPALTTDIIVGFPGETEEEFGTTYANLAKLHLYEMHIFKYSKRRGTVAEQMPNQVDETIKTERSNQLLNMTQIHKQEYEKQFSGEIVKVLIEEQVLQDNIMKYVGHTERYIKVYTIKDYDCRNEIVEVKL